MLPLKQLLRAPRTIVVEIAAIVLACAIGATVPQVGVSSPPEIERFFGDRPALHSFAQSLALDGVFRSPWFLAILVVSGASLLIVIAEQVRQLRASWSRPVTRAHFSRAPFRQEFTRSARLELLPQREGSTRIERRGRASLAGSPLFHIGLLAIVVAGILRAAFGTGAVVDVIEGETLPPGAAAWGQQWSGAFHREFSLPEPVTLGDVSVTTYPSGGLRQLSATLRVGNASEMVVRHLAVNEQLSLSGRKLYMSSLFGPAAFVVFERPGTSPDRQALLMNPEGLGYYAASIMSRGRVVHLRTRAGVDLLRPGFVDVRVMQGPALAWAGILRIGESSDIGHGERLSLASMPLWIRLWGSHDPMLWLAWTGFAAVLAGATLMFSVVEVSTMVHVEPAGEPGLETVVVALSPRRFTPLFEEDFRRLVRQEGGET